MMLKTLKIKKLFSQLLALIFLMSSLPVTALAGPKDDKAYKYTSSASGEKYSKAAGKYNIEGVLQQYFVGLTAITFIDSLFKREHLVEPDYYGDDCPSNSAPNPQLMIARASGAAYLFGDIYANWTFRKHSTKAMCLAEMIKKYNEKKANEASGDSSEAQKVKPLKEECVPYEKELKSKIDEKNDFQAVSFESVRDILKSQEKALKTKIALAALATSGYAASAIVEGVNIASCNKTCGISKTNFTSLEKKEALSLSKLSTLLTTLNASATASLIPGTITSCSLLATQVAQFSALTKAKVAEQKAKEKAYKAYKAKKAKYNLANLAATLYPIVGEFKKTAKKKKDYEEGKKLKDDSPKNVASVGWTTEEEWKKDPAKALTKLWKDVYLVKKIYGKIAGEKKVKKLKDYEIFKIKEKQLTTSAAAIQKTLLNCQLQAKIGVATAKASATSSMGTLSHTVPAAISALNQSHKVGMILGNYLTDSYQLRYTPQLCCGGSGIGNKMAKEIKVYKQKNEAIIMAVSKGSAKASLMASVEGQKIKGKVAAQASKQLMSQLSSQISSIQSKMNSTDASLVGSPQSKNGKDFTGIVGSLPYLSTSGLGSFPIEEDLKEVNLLGKVKKADYKPKYLSPYAQQIAYEYFYSLMNQAIYRNVLSEDLEPQKILLTLKEKEEELDRLMFHFKVNLSEPIDIQIAQKTSNTSILSALLDQFFIPSAHAGEGTALKVGLMVLKRVFQSLDTNHKFFKDKNWTTLLQASEKYMKMKDIIEYSMIYKGMVVPKHRMLFWSILTGASAFSISWSKKGLKETQKREQFFEEKLNELKHKKQEPGLSGELETSEQNLETE
jgi:hypothetical protein